MMHTMYCDHEWGKDGFFRFYCLKCGILRDDWLDGTLGGSFTPESEPLNAGESALLAGLLSLAGSITITQRSDACLVAHGDHFLLTDMNGAVYCIMCGQVLYNPYPEPEPVKVYKSDNNDWNALHYREGQAPNPDMFYGAAYSSGGSAQYFPASKVWYVDDWAYDPSFYLDQTF